MKQWWGRLLCRWGYHSPKWSPIQRDGENYAVTIRPPWYYSYKYDIIKDGTCRRCGAAVYDVVGTIRESGSDSYTYKMLEQRILRQLEEENEDA
jgi:hypothetical protein